MVSHLPRWWEPLLSEELPGVLPAGLCSVFVPKSPPADQESFSKEGNVSEYKSGLEYKYLAS